MTNYNEQDLQKLIEIVQDSFVDENEIIELRERKIEVIRALSKDEQNVKLLAQLVSIEMMLTMATMKKTQRENYIRNNK